MLKNINLLYFVNTLSAFQFYGPIRVIYFVQVTGSYSQAMLIFALDSLFQAILEVPTGIFSDRIGRKKTTIISGIAALICLSLWAIGGGFWILLTGSLFGALAGALSSGNDEALIFDSLKESGREGQFHEVYGRIGTFTMTAFGISALLGGFLYGMWFEFVFWLSVLFKLISVLISFYIADPRISDKINSNPYLHLREALQLFVSNPRLRMLSISNAINNSISLSSYQFAPVFINTLWPVWAVGANRSAVHFLSAAGSYISIRVINRFKAFNALVGQFVISRVILLSAYIFPTVFSPVLMALTSILFGVGLVSQKKLIQQEFSDHQRATMGSLDSLLTRILIALVSVLFGVMADLIGPGNISLLGEFLVIPVLFIYWRLFLHNKHSAK